MGQANIESGKRNSHAKRIMKKDLVPLRAWDRCEWQPEEGRIFGEEVGGAAVVGDERSEDTEVATSLNNLLVDDELANHEEHERQGKEEEQGDKTHV